MAAKNTTQRPATIRLIALVWLLCSSLSLAQEAAGEAGNSEEAGKQEAGEAVAGEIQRVTLYRDQALVTRRIEVPAGEAADGSLVREILVGRLPERVVVDSVYAEGSDAVEVRGVRVTQQAAAGSQRAEVNELRKAAEELQAQHEQVRQELELLNKKMEHINGLMAFNLSASQVDRNRGVLDAKSLIEVTNFSLDQQTSLHAQQVRLQQQLAELAEAIVAVERRSQLLAQPTSTQYEVRMLVAMAAAGQGGAVELSYLVSGCKWSPQYTIRGEIGQEQFSLRYSALVEQMSGEDWKAVQLTLSTASPSMGAAGPSLTPFRITVGGGAEPFPSDDPFGMAAGAGYGGEGGVGSPQQALQERSKGLRQQQQQLNSEYAGRHSRVDNLTRDYALNAVASEVQNLELSADAQQLKTLASDADDEVASQTYLIQQAVSLDSRREQQLVSIVDTRLDGSLYHVATPLLSSFAYREADMINNQTVGLLRGPAIIYLGGRFVGRTEIPSIASGQHLIVGFGADNQVRTRRELLDKIDEIQGGNRRLTFRYRIVVANFKAEAVNLRLYDRLPLADQTGEISVRPLEFQQPISTDGLYARLQKPRGILRWDLSVPEEQFGEKAFDVEYSYSVEFDRSRVLTANISEAQIATDYQDIVAPGSVGGMGGGMGQPRP